MSHCVAGATASHVPTTLPVGPYAVMMYRAIAELPVFAGTSNATRTVPSPITEVRTLVG